MKSRLLLIAALSLAVTACDETTDPTDGGTDAGEEMEDLLRSDCDPVIPEFCALPFPSNQWLAEDATTPTGSRIALGETTLPRSQARRRLPVGTAPFNQRDGWSVNASILAYLPGATATGLPGHQDLDASLADGALTVLMNAETGELVPHFSEIDESVGMEDAPRTLIIRPVVVLDHDTRYLVAVRGVVDAGGAVLPAPETFAALRDNTPSEIPTVEARRAGIEDVLTTLASHGVDRADLQLAWDFNTGSQEYDTRWLLALRDRAFAALGTDGPEFRLSGPAPEWSGSGTPDASVTTFTEEENATVRQRIIGYMTVPLFLDQPGPGAVLNLGADGLPEQNGTAEYPFIAVIPRNVTPDNPGRPLQYGHGLLGRFTQADSGFRNEWANENGFIPFGVDWIGMSENDTPVLVAALANGTAQDFQTVPERGVQGIVNSLIGMRLMLRGFGDHADVQTDGRSPVDTSEGFYTGDSQGGIFGGTYMAVTQDVTRGVLGVPGQPYNILLNRSTDFDPYLAFLRGAFRDGVDLQIVQSLLQMLWDVCEPGAFTSHISRDMFPDTPEHTVIMQPAIGDFQVTTLGAHIMARAIGARTLAPQTRPVWGIEEATPPYTGSVMIEFEYGIDVPVTNRPPRTGSDPHGLPRRQATALAQVLHFFNTGEMIHTCDGICDPE